MVVEAGEDLRQICRQAQIRRLFLFGSASRNEMGVDSDVDLLVEFAGRTSLLGMLRIERELSAVIGRRVDLVTPESLSPYIRERIRDDLQLIYEAI
jgi:predicted nucleotidyltransferase